MVWAAGMLHVLYLAQHLDKLPSRNVHQRRVIHETTGAFISVLECWFSLQHHFNEHCLKTDNDLVKVWSKNTSAAFLWDIGPNDRDTLETARHHVANRARLPSPSRPRCVLALPPSTPVRKNSL